ncbi:hypothetical protein FHR70_003776 [Microvirga lupini]|uniref:Uncharacterized protein n=1 Tax=Microvirga lupini TaxID=420324 RepID=A0A7W4YXN4_9HYPH|nr:hypothetical protein [Microvirga lupini]MBB3020690.1 hypothetical protein [Microvirga lupini]
MPTEPEKGLYQEIVKHLGPHGPDALLTAILFAGTAGLIKYGLDPWLAIGFALILLGVYAWRQTRAEGHRERMAEIRVREREAEIKALRDKHKFRLEKERLQNSADTPRIGGKKR